MSVVVKKVVGGAAVKEGMALCLLVDSGRTDRQGGYP
jgi:hypothetical protein